MADRERQRLTFAHQEWLGFVQPVGLLVSPMVMVDAQVVPDRNVSARQREFRELLDEDTGGATSRWRAPDLRRLFLEYLGWEAGDLLEAATDAGALEIALPELQAVLAPTWAVPADDGDTRWTMLVGVEDEGVDLDRAPDNAGWNATRHARFERLLRETGVPIGLLCTDERVRLIYAPQGESSGHATFEFSQMAQPPGRPILAAFDMLLAATPLFSAPPDGRLPALLARSREAQAEVSTRLSRQVLAALHELLRGFVAADVRGVGSTAELVRRDPEHLYGGLVTTLMRLVFVLYAEDRALMPGHPVYQQHYSLGGLFARLRADAAAWPDTMDQRFGAWSQLLSLFRLIHGGGSHERFSFVARKGALFDPERFPFLEGLEGDGDVKIPLVPDATVWNVLRSLMVLDGERLSYRTLDVEQIGSVYEAVMGFRVELTQGRSIAVTAPQRSGAAAVVDLDHLLEIEGAGRARALREATDRSLTGRAQTALRGASTIEGLVAALERVIDRDATPDVVPRDTPVLQPTDERRRSGSHYTPRSLTEPIVSEALRPVLERLGPDAPPDEVLDLKVLDPATGSGAFLVEACRQLSGRLVEAWSRHGGPPDLSADEDELLHARRLIAQRCLYGVDRNPMAIDLARLSLWLVTLARDHEFTFIDHALRHGDALVGLTRAQIEGFHWSTEAKTFQYGTERVAVRQHLDRVAELRELIRELGDRVPERELRELLDEAECELENVHRVADLVLAAFFEGDKAKDRESRRALYSSLLIEQEDSAGGASEAPRPPVAAFHWELEFPEVFDRENPGFDVIVGNPPFGGKNTLAAANPRGYATWLRQLHPESHGNADLVAHFYRRAFNLLREDGTFGLIATNTIGQGDTRSTGLRWICTHGGRIYRALRRYPWPGTAAVVVSVVHVAKGGYAGPRTLDGQDVNAITAYLFHSGGHEDPEELAANGGKSFVGSYVLGMGFTFDDTDRKGVASSLATMRRLTDSHPGNRDVISPYIGGEEVNTSPIHAHHRYVINFRDWPLRRADLRATWKDADTDRRRDWRREGIVPLDYPEPVAADWPEMLAIVEERVKPGRMQDNRASYRRNWWHYAEKRSELYAAIAGLHRVVASCRVSKWLSFTLLRAERVFDVTLNVFPCPESHLEPMLAVLSSRPHEIWARFFGSTLEDRLRYTPSDCFETFPFPHGWERDPALEAAGDAYYNFRMRLMVDNGEGLTKTYNRFHDPDERDRRIVRLRELHAAMDRAVLDAYGWDDIPTDCEFLLDYEVDEEAPSKRKKPWRFRWCDDIRDEVLARLSDLNAECAADERIDPARAWR